MAAHVREVFWLLDWESQRMVYASPAYETVWGRPVTALLDDFGEWVRSIHPDDRKAAEDWLASIAATRGAETREYRIVRPDGAVRWIADRGVAIAATDGRVTRLMPYGAFVELTPGLEGMVHISELSWSRLEKAEDAVKPGQTIRVKVLRIEPGKKGPKIALSVKQVEGDPWDRLPETIRPGQKISGKVTRCADFGAFVEIVPGIEGLVHISEMSYTQRVHKPQDVVSTGQAVSVMVKEVDMNKRRIGLSLRDAEGDPWLEVDQKLAKGQPVNGTVEKQEAFGTFVRLAPGIVGLLPKSAISRSPNAATIDRLKSGDAIAVVVEEINKADRRISLKPHDAGDEDQWQQFKADKDNSSMGALGEKLARALKKSDK
jgi:small subunit ribosomal protein S1